MKDERDDVTFADVRLFSPLHVAHATPCRRHDDYRHSSHAVTLLRCLMILFTIFARDAIRDVVFFVDMMLLVDMLTRGVYKMLPTLLLRVTLMMPLLL